MTKRRFDMTVAPSATVPRVAGDAAGPLEGLLRARQRAVGAGDFHRLRQLRCDQRHPRWWGYDSLSGSYAFISYELTSGTTRTGLSTYPFDPNLSPTSPLSSLARRQPFTVTDDAVLFAFWNASLGIQQWPFSGNARPLIEDAERSHLRVLERDDGSLVTLSYDTTADCQPASCALAFTAFTGDIASPLAPAAVPTRYVEPVGDGDRVLWLDRRDGPYALYGVTPDGHELRLSSEKAEIGALSSIAAGNGRVVWADRRSGRWRLMSRDW